MDQLAQCIWKLELFCCNIHHRDPASFKIRISSTMLKFKWMKEKASHCTWISTGCKRQAWQKYKRRSDTGIHLSSYCSNPSPSISYFTLVTQHSLPKVAALPTTTPVLMQTRNYLKTRPLQCCKWEHTATVTLELPKTHTTTSTLQLPWNKKPIFLYQHFRTPPDLLPKVFITLT